MLEAIRSVQDAWEMLIKSSVTSCWRLTGILDDDVYELVEGMDRYVSISKLVVSILSNRF